MVRFLMVNSTTTSVYPFLVIYGNNLGLYECSVGQPSPSRRDKNYLKGAVNLKLVKPLIER